MSATRMITTTEIALDTSEVSTCPHSAAERAISMERKSGRLPFDIPYDVPQKGYKILGMIDGTVCSVIDLSGATRPDLLAVLDRAFNKKVTTRNWKTIERCYQAMQAGVDV